MRIMGEPGRRVCRLFYAPPYSCFEVLEHALPTRPNRQRSNVCRCDGKLWAMKLLLKLDTRLVFLVLFRVREEANMLSVDKLRKACSLSSIRC